MADDQTNERYDDVDALLGDLDDDEEESYASDASDVAASGVGSILGSSSLSNLETISAEANATELTNGELSSDLAMSLADSSDLDRGTLATSVDDRDRDKDKDKGDDKDDDAPAFPRPLDAVDNIDQNSVRRIAPIASATSIAPISVPNMGSVPAIGKFTRVSSREKIDPLNKTPDTEPSLPPVTPLRPDADKADKVEKLEVKSEKVDVKAERDDKGDVDADDKTDDVRTSSPKRPPVPPKMPSMPSAARVLRENEVVYTQEALNDILPGGKNDDGRDLAYKFNDNNWYANVFNEDYLRTLPRSLPRQTMREVRFIIDKLGIQRGARVLDLCCGAGRHTVELSAKGYDMVGVDLSMFLLKRALDTATKKNLSIKFVHGDMRKLTFRSIFDAVFNVQTSFGYFDDLTNFKVLQSIYASLKPGGIFLIETVNRDFIMDDMPLRLFWMGDGCKVLEESNVESLSGVLKVKRSIVLDDNSKPPYEQTMSIRLYSTTEMRQLLSRAGFNVLELVGDFSLPDPRHFGAYSPHNIFIAEKPI